MQYHGQSISVEYKGDDSPLTRADRTSHEMITEALSELDGTIPVLSEESDPEELEHRRAWDRFWLVDPLDGTKEFLKESGEFTVNIALIDGQEPALGVIYVPAKQISYFAETDTGAFRQDGRSDPEEISTRPADAEQLVVVASRDHAGDRVNAFLNELPEARLRSLGSSLKFCLVAEGEADCYIRDVPTMEWDTGAAQCIVEAAGGTVTDWDGDRLTYNKESLTNPYLMTVGDPDWNWQPLLG